MISDDRQLLRSESTTCAARTAPGEALWQLHTDHATWSCELRVHGEWGVEAQILKNGELVIGRRFDTKALAVQWAELERETVRKNETLG